MNPILPSSTDRPFWPFNLRAGDAGPPKQLPTWLHASDLQGLAQLATQASLGLTTVAEAVQGQVYKIGARPLGPIGAKFVDTSPGASGIRPGSLTSLFYGSARLATRVAGGTVHSVMSRVATRAGRRPSSAPREAMLAAVNGVLGDHLVETANPLAITMSLRQAGETLPLNRDALTLRFPQAAPRVLVLVHGLGMNDLQWSGAGPEGPHDLGQLLERDVGYSVVRVHYNTGLHPAVNGAQLASLLEMLALAWPRPVEGIAVLAHGAGGLVARSASHQGALAGHVWRGLLEKMVFLGTPHQGVPPETLDSWMHERLAAGLVTWPLAQLGRLRSAGMQAFASGEVLPPPVAAEVAGLPVPAPLPLDVDCFTVAAATGPRPVDESSSARLQMENPLLDDGLVPLRSACGAHADPARELHFQPGRRHIAWQTHHQALLQSTEVAAVVRGWLGRDAA
ncbi:MAG: alpha/beta hydrolase [Polaromonas sp.]|nr:alpha/beta hydrolase [Polaromonas sp.]